MNQRIGVYDPDTARLVLETVRYLRAAGFVVKPPTSGSPLQQPAEEIYIRNDSGVEIPAWGCVQTSGTVEAGGQNYITVTKPVDAVGTAGWYLFNGQAPIADGDYGVAHDGPLVRMLTDGTSVSCGDMWQPVVGQFTVTDGGSLFTAVGDDDIGANVMRAFCYRGVVGVRFYRYTLNEDWSAGLADADILELDGTDTTIDADIHDPLGTFSALGNGDAGYCFLQDGEYYAIQAPCPT